MIRKPGRKGRCSKCVKCAKNRYNFFADRNDLEAFLQSNFKNLPGNGMVYLTAFENAGYIHLYSCPLNKIPYKTAASWGTDAAKECSEFEPKPERGTIRRGEKCVDCYENLRLKIDSKKAFGEYVSQFHRHDNKAQALELLKEKGEVWVFRCRKSAERFYMTPGIKNSRGKCDHFNGGNDELN